MGLLGPNLGPPIFFLWVSPLLVVRHCSKLSLHAISRETNESKNLVSGPSLVHLAQIWAPFFSKIWLHQSLDIMVSYHHVQYQKKLKIQSWENLVTDRWTDRQTDGQTDRSDFIGRCLTDVECQMIRIKWLSFLKRQHYIFYLPIVILHCVNMKKTARPDIENLNLQQMDILLVSGYLGGGIIFCLTQTRNNRFQAPNTLRLLNFPIQLQYS